MHEDPAVVPTNLMPRNLVVPIISTPLACPHLSSKLLGVVELALGSMPWPSTHRRSVVGAIAELADIDDMGAQSVIPPPWFMMSQKK
jgi:hypothetical protein